MARNKMSWTNTKSRRRFYPFFSSDFSGIIQPTHSQRGLGVWECLFTGSIWVFQRRKQQVRLRKTNQRGRRKSWRRCHTGSSQWGKSVTKGKQSTAQILHLKSVGSLLPRLTPVPPPMGHLLLLSHTALGIPLNPTACCMHLSNRRFLEGNLHITCTLLFSPFITKFCQFYFFILPLNSSAFLCLACFYLRPNYYCLCPHWCFLNAAFTVLCDVFRKLFFLLKYNPQTEKCTYRYYLAD